MDDSLVDRDNLNEDVERMQALWINEMVRVSFFSQSVLLFIVASQKGSLHL